MRISDWSSDVCSSDHAVQALRALQFLDPEFAQEHLEIIDNAWHHRLDAGLIGRLLEFEADAQLQEARLASPAVEADQHLEIGRASCRESVFSTCRSRWSTYH